MDWWMQISVFFNTASTFYSFMSNKNNTNLWSHEWILVWKCGQCPWHPVPDASLAQDCVTEGWSLQHPRNAARGGRKLQKPWCFTGCCISTTGTPPPQKKKSGVGKGWVLGMLMDIGEVCWLPSACHLQAAMRGSEFGEVLRSLDGTLRDGSKKSRCRTWYLDNYRKLNPKTSLIRVLKKKRCP